jgi:hypothetical protein
MKRDMDLVREILRQLEDHPDPNRSVEIEVEGRSEPEINYHLYLLNQAGLIQAENVSDTSEFAYLPLRLTWQGHEFLDAARDDTRWNAAKRMVVSTTGGLAFEFLRAVLIQKGKDLLGLE